MDSEDARCIARMAHGDQGALGELYARYRPRLHRYLWHQLHGDSSLVEEVLQDTFLAVWRAAGSFRGEARVATWVFRIAQRCAGHAQRRSPGCGEAPTLSLDALGEEEALPTPPDHETSTLTRLALLDALRRLPAKQRAVILLIFVQGFTSEETAQILAVPQGTVKSRLHAARALLSSDPALQPSEEVSQ